LKKDLRKQIMKTRNNLSINELNEKSIKVFQTLKNEKSYLDKSNILSFMSFGSEINMDYVNKDLIARNGYVLLPKVNETKDALEIYKVTSYDDFVLSDYKILEPDPAKCQRIPYKDIELILSPGVVFDRKGYRIGYGGGFYDRLITETSSECVVIGVGFDLQLVDTVPKEDHDRQLDALITETGKIIF